ncbi:hypothetical protein RHSIM_Rhsim04G0014200 [Rhododendron simsii]|uniref:Cytochrome P450 n=1 Tax=Rhododendron simsii TaxID=118357 RepID=A0A834GZ76_RHOSS|nr:hypothetical protein RHSIM_Rhsim04G0014200 [Rhododendron simsii]
MVSLNFLSLPRTSNPLSWSVSQERELPINLSKKIYSLTYGIVGRAAFGKKSKYQEELISIVEEATPLVAGFTIVDMYPSVKLLEVITGLRRTLEKMSEKLDQDIIAAGSETSSTVVEWAMSELLKNPQLLKRAQDEVRDVFDKKGNVDETGLHELKYLNSIVKETLRLHPSAPLLVPRESSEKCLVSGCEIPAKTKVIVNAWAIGRDPTCWTEPEKFDPERFIDSEIDYKGTDFKYIPFGAGRRICPGMSFALPNMELPLAQLLYHFDWKLPNGMKHEELDMEERFGLTVRRKHDLYLIPIPYNHRSPDK